MFRRSLSIISIGMLLFSALLPPAGSTTQAGLAGLDVSALVDSVVSIFAGRNCDFATESPRDPEGVPSFDALLDSCPQGSRGSGTILDDEGTILTNAHVVLSSLDLDAQPLWLLVSVTSDPREAPAPAFFAWAEMYDVLLDLAIIRPYYDLDGHPIGSREIEALNLRPLPISPAPANIGDEILNVGYPGVGGDLVTVTSGRVAGFQADLNNPDLANEGWIKTDATLGGGVSGGASINAAGQLIGVPTRVGGIELREFAANTPVPVSQINYIRPVNVGLPELTQRARESGQPTVPMIEEYLLESEATIPGEGGEPPLRPNPNEVSTLDGRDQEVDQDAADDPSAVMQETSAPAMVTVSGRVIEVNTGEPIEGALFAVLQPGHTFQEWYADGLPASTLYTGAETGPDGTFTLYDPLEAGQEYTYIVAAEGYDFVWGNQFEIVPAGTEDDLELAPIQLRPSPIFTTNGDG